MAYQEDNTAGTAAVELSGWAELTRDRVTIGSRGVTGTCHGLLREVCVVILTVTAPGL